MKKITLGILDDDLLFSEALTSLLSSIASFEVLFCASDGKTLFEAFEAKGSPDILISDLKLKDESGLDLAVLLRERYPEQLIVALSSFYKPIYVATALRNGLAAFLPKSCASKELVEALRQVAETGMYYRPADLVLIRDFLQNPQSTGATIDSPTPLSDREIEIVKLICNQCTNAEIADQLFLSVRTVEGHRNRILEKTGIRNSAGLVVFAISNGIVDVSELSLRNNLSAD